MAQGHRPRQPRTRRERRVMRQRQTTADQPATPPEAEPLLAPPPRPSASVAVQGARPARRPEATPQQQGPRLARMEQTVRMPHVVSDLRRIAVVSAVIAILLAVLFFVLR